MPPLNFMILIGCVIAAAALTVALLQGVLTSGGTIAFFGVLAALLVLRVILMRK